MEMESESTYLEVEKPTVEVDVQEPPPPVEEEGKDETASSPPPPTVVETFTIPPPPPDSPAPPPEPMHAPEYDDGIHKSMAENPAMAAVDKLWEAEYSDVPTDLDSILVCLAPSSVLYFSGIISINLTSHSSSLFCRMRLLMICCRAEQRPTAASLWRSLKYRKKFSQRKRAWKSTLLQTILPVPQRQLVT